MVKSIAIPKYSQYTVSHKGVITSPTGKVLKSYKDSKKDVILVCLRNRDTHQARINRLCYIVAKTFIDNPNNYKYVIHKDGDFSNNSVDNLEWSNIHPILRNPVVVKNLRTNEVVEFLGVYACVRHLSKKYKILESSLYSYLSRKLLKNKFCVYNDYLIAFKGVVPDVPDDFTLSNYKSERDILNEHLTKSILRRFVIEGYVHFIKICGLRYYAIKELDDFFNSKHYRSYFGISDIVAYDGCKVKKTMKPISLTNIVTNKTYHFSSLIAAAEYLTNIYNTAKIETIQQSLSRALRLNKPKYKGFYINKQEVKNNG